jgi:WD40 repeat protein
MFLKDDGTVAHGICGDNTLRAWKVATGDEVGIYCPDSMLTAATAMNPAARFACGTRDGQIHMLQLRI